jgi:hypothetical protein
VAASVRDPLWACAYLLAFGTGTLVGMALITTGLALPVASAAARWTYGQHSIRLATGGLAVAMGLWLVYQIGWNDGLFLAAPAWTPH